MRVTHHAAESVAKRVLTVTEDVKAGGGLTIKNLRLKPGDQATVRLAGNQVIKGFVVTRQAAFNAATHAVLISIESKMTDPVHSTAPLTTAQFKNKKLQQIADNMLKPFGIKVKTEGKNEHLDRPFKDVSINPGETVWSVIDNLCRMRNVQPYENAEGDLVLAYGASGQAGDLIEDKNILSANEQIDDHNVFSSIEAYGQDRSDGGIDDETARKPKATVEGGATRYRPYSVFAEEPGSSIDMKARVERERAALDNATINAKITVQGWLKSDGNLWKIREIVTVNSPMLLLDKVQLGVQSLVFSQDIASGTPITLEIVKPAALSMNGPADPSIPGNGSQPAQVAA